MTVLLLSPLSGLTFAITYVKFILIYNRNGQILEKCFCTNVHEESHCAAQAAAVHQVGHGQYQLTVDKKLCVCIFNDCL